MRILHLIYFALFILFINSCSGDDDASTTTNPLPPDEETLGSGFFILNEGQFLQGTGSISFVPSNFNGIQNDVFANANSGEMLGDIVQSATIYGDKIYLIVNNSNRIVIANKNTMERIGSIEANEGLMNPRFMSVSGSKGFVSNWGNGVDTQDDFIAVIDLESDEIETTISVPEGPEKMITWNDSVYVLHQGGFGQNNIISVINPENNTNSDSITVGDVPQSFVVENNQFFVLCRGRIASDFVTTESAAEIWRIDENNMANELYNFDSLGFTTPQHAIDLQFANNQFFYQITTAQGRGVYRFSPNGFGDTEQIIDRSFYNLSIIGTTLFGTDAMNFASAGSVNLYTLDGSLAQVFTAGIVPTFILQNN